MLGITGVSSDMREIEKAAEQGNERAILGLKMYRYRIKKIHRSLCRSLRWCRSDHFYRRKLVKNDPVTREECCTGLEYMGVEFDKSKNDGVRSKEMLLSKDNSKVKVMTIPTNEELMIAEHTYRIVNS